MGTDFVKLFTKTHGFTNEIDIFVLMKKFNLLLFSLLFTTVFSQSKLTVLQAGSESPIFNATVYCGKNIVGKTNSQGVLEFKTKCKKVDVKATGFYESDVVVDKVMEISLTKVDPKTHSIETVMINDKSDPRALEILQKVNDNFKNNSPQSLDSYAFKSYEKISLDFDEDSIKHYSNSLNQKIDSLKSLPKKNQPEKAKKDSIESVKVMKLFTKSKLFLWERASEFLYSQKYGEKINILDNRIAGLREPVYELMALRSNRNRIPREIREENRSLYRFFLTDSIDIDGRKNFVIRFRDAGIKKPVPQRKFNGYIYVDAETYGLKKIESNSNKKSEGSITSIWTPIHNKWFLAKENLKMRMGMTYMDQKYKTDQKTGKKEEVKNRKGFGNYVFLTADYFDFQTPIQEKKKDFEGYSMSVKNADGSTLDKFRTDSLTLRERMTYNKIDSVGKKYNLDNKINIFTGLIKGNVRVGNVDFDASQILKYNQYEGFRLGLAAKLNEKFHPYISPDAYFAYGFKDEAWKYGAGIDVKTTLRKNSFFRAEYYHDVMAAGRFNENLWNFRMKIMNSGVDLNNDRFYQYEGFKVSYQNDLSNALTMVVSAKRDQEEAKFNYSFMNLGKQFTNFSTQLTLKYAPRSKNIMTPSGKFTYEQNFPEYFLNYEQGIQSFGGDFIYSRFDILAQHRFKTDIGVTGVRAYAGLVLGKTPIWHQFAMNGLGNGENSLNFNLTSFLGFATMEGGKYYSDKFAGYYFTHRIPWYFKTFGKNISSFDMVYRGVIGEMKNPEYHQFDFQKLNHLYQEVGLEWNNFAGVPLNLGFFYRVGYYATSEFKENFGLQLKFNFLGF